MEGRRLAAVAVGVRHPAGDGVCHPAWSRLRAGGPHRGRTLPGDPQPRRLGTLPTVPRGAAPDLLGAVCRPPDYADLRPDLPVAGGDRAGRVGIITAT